MKKILLAFCCSLSIYSFAQNSLHLATLNNTKTSTVTSIGNGANINEITTSGNTTTTKIRVYNNSASTNTYNLVRIDEVLNPSASAYFCIASNCYPPSTTSLPSNDLLIISSGSFDNNFTIDIDEAPTVGLSRIRYKLYNVNNANDTLSFKVNYNGPTAIKKQSETVKTIEVFPNPSNFITYLKISSANNTKGSIKLINSLGSIIYNKDCNLNTGENTVEFSVESLKAGMYFIEVYADNSKITKKLIIK
ncbi:MAG: T9SS type A sorting domain-containing protein [Bacteroidetes bacterium]|nr:T9SS type A sorting domain-containing protein [Bacteroidota bacterium]